jgi:hypothetical protein
MLKSCAESMNYKNDRDPWHFLIGMNGSETGSAWPRL